VCLERKISLSAAVSVTCPAPEAGAGAQEGQDYAIRRGREVMIEAMLDGAHGQAYTDRPSNWSGTLGDVFSMPLKAVRNRAIVVAALNALAVKLGLITHSIRCPHEETEACGRELASELKRRFPEARKVLLVGLQPGVLAALAAEYGTSGVRVIDLDSENIGQVKHGVRVGNGDADITNEVRWCDVLLVTGSSIVNGTLDGLLKHSRNASRPLVFYGNTIAAVAAVADLDRICALGGA
jgi:hypothetical protein